MISEFSTKAVDKFVDEVSIVVFFDVNKAFHVRSIIF